MAFDCNATSVGETSFWKKKNLNLRQCSSILTLFIFLKATYSLLKSFFYILPRKFHSVVGYNMSAFFIPVKSANPRRRFTCKISCLPSLISLLFCQQQSQHYYQHHNNSLQIIKMKEWYSFDDYCDWLTVFCLSGIKSNSTFFCCCLHVYGYKIKAAEKREHHQSFIIFLTEIKLITVALL